MISIIRVSFFEASDSVVVRGVVQAYKKMNLAVDEKNRLDLSGGKIRLVHLFRTQEFWKCIGCILSEVTYGNKGYNIEGGTQISVDKKE